MFAVDKHIQYRYNKRVRVRGRRRQKRKRRGGTREGHRAHIPSVITDAQLEAVTPEGLLMRHEYSLLALYEISPELTLVKLRNPHGVAGWTGAWSEGSGLWTPEIWEQVRRKY